LVYTLYRSVMGLLLFVVLGEQKFTPWLTFRYSVNRSFCTVEKSETVHLSVSLRGDAT
jgi:hypothetical protein